MGQERVERRLAAIFVADVVGYSVLIRADEEGTRAAVRQHVSESFEPQVAIHNGRIFKTVGDGLLAEFGSVVDAVRCAVEIQNNIRNHNANVVAKKRVEFRIGVNLGDVIAEGDDLHGDGVNVAARLEGLAKPQGICISGSAFEQVRDKLEVGFEDLGDQQVKNIDRPVRAYRIQTDAVMPGRVVVAMTARLRRWKWPVATAFVALVALLVAGHLGVFPIRLQSPNVEPASPERMAFVLPDEPSIAVLPFDNLSDDPEQEYLADGITENIINALSKIPNMFVIARNSTFTYKGKAVMVQQVAEEMGVRYVLGGGVQRSGDRIRVTAQLVDAVKGNHLWSDQYDRNLTDLFAVQDEITLRIVSELQVRFTEGDRARGPFGYGTRNLKAWASAIQGFALFRTLTKEDNTRAQQLLEKATKLDPSYAWAWTVLAWTHWNDARNGWSDSRAESFDKAFELANKSKSLNDSVPFTYSLLGALHLLKREYEQAIAHMEKAVALDPNGADAKALLGVVLTYAGGPREAATLLERAMRLNPRYPGWYLVTLGRAYRLSGRLGDAIVALERAKQRIPRNDHARVVLTTTYLEAGREAEARDEAAAILKLAPKFSVREFANVIPYKDPEQIKRVLDALRQTGLPE